MDMGLTKFQKKLLDELDCVHNVMIQEAIEDWISPNHPYHVYLTSKRQTTDSLV